MTNVIRGNFIYDEASSLILRQVSDGAITADGDGSVISLPHVMHQAGSAYTSLQTYGILFENITLGTITDETFVVNMKFSAGTDGGSPVTVPVLNDAMVKGIPSDTEPYWLALFDTRSVVNFLGGTPRSGRLNFDVSGTAPSIALDARLVRIVQI